MVQIAGTYKNEKNENLLEYLLAIGLSEEIARMGDKTGDNLEIGVDGNKYTFKSYGPSRTFTLNETFDEPLPTTDRVFKSIAKLDGDKLIVSTESTDGRKGSRTYEFTESGIKLTLATSTVTAYRYYIRE